MHRRFKAPSPAFVVATIALFVALGGTGYAARGAIFSSPSKAQIVKIVKGVAPTLKVAGLAPLPSGKTETGLFTGGGTGNAGYIAMSILYPRPLSAPIADDNVIDVLSGSAAHCPGRGRAAPGYLCLYDTIENNTDPLNDVYSTDTSYIGNFGKYGVDLYWNITGSSPYVGGTWAVTAP